MLSTDPELSRALAVRAIEGGLLRLKWLAAATRFELAMLRHDRALKYRPDQPRVPAGNPDGGQWTIDAGSAGGGSSTAHKPAAGSRRNDPRVLSDATPDPIRPGSQYAQNRPRGGGVNPLVINGVEVEPTPGQAARLAVAEAQAQAAIREVQQLDPNWKPEPSLYSTVEGYIAATQADAQQARDRLMELRSVGIGPGPFAGESIPAGEGVTAADRRELNRIGSETGCHTCGTLDPKTKTGNFVADHQPPTALNFFGAAQRLYPQCLSCSMRQGGWVTKLKP